MSTYRVRAKRWEHGWELHISEDQVTQCHTLATADMMVRDYLEVTYEVDASDYKVTIVPDPGGDVGQRTTAACARVAAANTEQRAATAEIRRVARELRATRLPISDIAVILGIGRGRVTRLTGNS